MSVGAQAQYGAKFSVNSPIGCDPFTVVVTDLSGAPDTVAINYDWGDGSPLDSAEYHTYASPGKYTIIQTVANANPRQDTAQIEIINHYPPEFYLFNCKGSIGSVFIRDTLYQAYQIDWGDGNQEKADAYTLTTHDYGFIGIFDVQVKGLINGSQTASDASNSNCSSNTKRLNMIAGLSPAIINQVQVLSTDVFTGTIAVDYSLPPDNNFLIEIKDQSQATFTIYDTINQTINPNRYIIQNLNTTDNYYCISITSFDPCDGQKFPSNIGCSINLNTVAQNQQNLLSWQTQSMDFMAFSVFKDGSNIANINNPNQTQYTDNQVVCGTSYQYLIQMHENNGFLSISDTSAVTAISTDIPPAISNISATVNGQDVNISWEPPMGVNVASFYLYKSTDGTNFTPVDTVTDVFYTDAGLFTQSTRYYYKIRYFDACGNLSADSQAASPVLLVPLYDKSLSWSNYTGWTIGVDEYILEKYDENGQIIGAIPMGLSTSYQEDQSTNPYQKITYKIVTQPTDNALSPVASNIIDIIYKSKVAFPNAFSPNGDGMNDVFNFKSRYIRRAEMKIFNHWGELIYVTDDKDRGWDGTVGGKPAPPGVYIHHTKLTDDMGITFLKTGEIILIR